MDDLISRQDALKALDEMSYKSPHESATSVVRKKHFGEILEKFIMQQPSAQQWIPCSERLPDQNGKYLVVGRQKAINILKFDGGRWYGKWGVVAWMPLPSPYREEATDG